MYVAETGSRTKEIDFAISGGADNCLGHACLLVPIKKRFGGISQPFLQAIFCCLVPMRG